MIYPVGTSRKNGKNEGHFKKMEHHWSKHSILRNAPITGASIPVFGMPPSPSKIPKQELAF
jgi:hypothetical protein